MAMGGVDANLGIDSEIGVDAEIKSGLKIPPQHGLAPLSKNHSLWGWGSLAKQD